MNVDELSLVELTHEEKPMSNKIKRNNTIGLRRLDSKRAGTISIKGAKSISSGSGILDSNNNIKLKKRP